jgi:N-acetylneuraminic acid mutarotase
LEPDKEESHRQWRSLMRKQRKTDYDWLENLREEVAEDYLAEKLEDRTKLEKDEKDYRANVKYYMDLCRWQHDLLRWEREDEEWDRRHLSSMADGKTTYSKEARTSEKRNKGTPERKTKKNRQHRKRRKPDDQSVS